MAITVPISEECRRFPRFAPADPVRVSLFDSHAVASDGIVADLSETGARVFTRKGLTEDDTVTVDLQSGGVWLFKTRGHVVWRRDDMLESVGSAQGLCFPDLSPFARKLLRRLSRQNGIEAAALERATKPSLVQAALTTESDPDLRFMLLGNELNGQNGKTHGKIDLEVELEHEPASRVLLVSPDTEARQVLRRHLEKSGIGVVAAPSMEEALACARLAPPQLIICEMALDGAVSGLELVHKIRADPALIATPIVLLADASGETRLDPAVGTADVCLRRPFEPEELVHRAKELLEDGRQNHSGELGGNFGVFKNTDILQMLEANLATGVLHIDGERHGEIHMHQGRICGSFSGSLTDEAAALHLIPVKWGRFRFVSTGVRYNLEQFRSTTQLILLALQRHDEGLYPPPSP